MSMVFQRGRAELQANLTPMIDVTFLLIVFFVLVSQIVEVENVDLELPELVEPLTETPGEEPRAVINVTPGPQGVALEYRMGSRSFSPDQEGLDRLAEYLAALFEKSPTIRVNLRADQRTHYEWVQPVLRSVSDAADRIDGGRITPRVNLVVVREE